MSIEVNGFIDLGLKIDETNTNPKNILLLGNTKGFFGSCSEDKNILTNSCGDEDTIKNNYFWLENEYNICNSNLYIIGNTDVCNYYHHIISDIASMMGKKPKYKYMDINICAKKKGISEEKEIEKYYVNILKEQRGKRVKFDKIIMNPPYDGNLHLKILEQVISLLKDDGDCINLSPIRWLQDPLLDYKKGTQYNVYEKTISKHIKSIIEINREVAQKWFENDINEPLGVYHIVKGAGGFDYESLHKSDEPGFIKVIALVLTKQLPSVLSIRSKEGSPDYNGYFIRLPKFRGHPGHKDWCNVIGLSFEEMTTRPSFGTCDATATFSSDIEVHNFFTSVHTTFYRYLCLISKSAQRVPYSALPFMGDCINPRTGKKGYESDWTDEDFCKYFDITDIEWEEIQETMKPYM